MNIIARRIAAGATLAVAPAIIALGLATAGHADTAPADNGPSDTSSVTAPHWTPNTPGVPENSHSHRLHHYYFGG